MQIETLSTARHAAGSVNVLIDSRALGAEDRPRLDPSWSLTVQSRNRHLSDGRVHTVQQLTH